MSEEMVMVIKPHFGSVRQARQTRMRIPMKDYEAEVAAAEKEERPCMFKLDEQQEDPPCFDGLSADDQKKVRDRQKKRAEEIAALEEADAE